MSMFAPKPTKPTEPPKKSRFQIILDDFNEARKRMEHAAHLLSSLMMDTEKGINFIDKFRHDLTQVIQDAGGTIVDTSIETEMAAFIPKRLADGQAQEVEE